MEPNPKSAGDMRASELEFPGHRNHSELWSGLLVELQGMPPSGKNNRGQQKDPKRVKKAGNWNLLLTFFIVEGQASKLLRSKARRWLAITALFSPSCSSPVYREI
jgi:hypothetical protein